MSFKDEAVVSGASALSMWICLTLRYSPFTDICSETYYWSIKLVHALPLLLARIHNVYLLV
jgi:hypothetical protein